MTENPEVLYEARKQLSLRLGESLNDIKNKQLYKPQYETFEQYIYVEYGQRPRWAQALIANWRKEKYGEQVQAKERRQPIYRIAISFTDGEDAKTVSDAFKYGQKAVGSNNIQTILVAMCQEVMAEWIKLAQGNETLDPVTRATHEQSDWTCAGCGGRKELHRHSHLHTHTGAEVTECVTLCAKCHQLYHDEKAYIEWILPGVTRFIRKDVI